MASLDWAAIEAAIATWARTASGLVFVWRRQETPRLPRPFGTLVWLATDSATGRAKGPGQDARLSTVTPGLVTHVAMREQTLTVQILSDDTTGSGAAHARLERLLETLRGQAVQRAFRTAGIVVQSIAGVTDLSAALDTQFESLASADLILGTCATATEDLGQIATVNETVTLVP